MLVPAKTPLKAGTRPKPRARKAAAEGGCKMGDLFRVLGKTHMLDILYVVMVEGDGRPRRFVDVQHALRLSPNTLSERLRELVQAGLLTRTAYNEIPPRVDYALTEKARDLEPVFATLRAWAAKHDLQPVPADAPAARA